MVKKTVVSVVGMTAASLLLLSSISSTVHAAPGYWTSASGDILRNAYGQCWRTPGWTPENGVAECGDAPEAKPAEPAPAPTPAPAVDSDGDGVVDGEDSCPNTPAGAEVDSKGCELDSDGDGVVNSKDKCPNTPAGSNVDANGCVVDGDDDGDGIANSKDKCPNSAAGEKVDSTGCKLEENIVLKGVNFENNSDVLKPESTATLDDVASTLKRYPEMKVEVAGYTDSRGTVKHNQALSQKRAKAVVKYLGEQGVNTANLTAKGYGPDAPVADNNTAEGRAANRRVELHIQN